MKKTRTHPFWGTRAKRIGKSHTYNIYIYYIYIYMTATSRHGPNFLLLFWITYLICQGDFRIDPEWASEGLLSHRPPPTKHPIGFGYWSPPRHTFLRFGDLQDAEASTLQEALGNVRGDKIKSSQFFLQGNWTTDIMEPWFLELSTCLEKIGQIKGPLLRVEVKINVLSCVSSI